MGGIFSDQLKPGLIDGTVTGFHSQHVFLLSLQTNGAFERTSGFQKEPPHGCWGPGENPGDLQTLDLLLLHFVSHDGAECKKIRGSNPLNRFF